MRFRASILEMASSEILQHIPANIYEGIKAKDSRPLFRAYVIGHEGESEGKIVGHGNLVKRWLTSAIDKIHERLQYGTKVFHGHAKTNEHSGRMSIGEIAGKAKEMIKGKLSAIAIAYIKPEYVDLPLDVASMEADIYLNNDQDRDIYDVNVEDITGVALGNSAVNRPGFPGATVVSQLQAFANQSQFNVGGEEMGNTASDLKKVIRAEGYVLTDLFSMGDITKDPMVMEHIDKLEEKFEKSLISRKKRINEGFDETKDKLVTDHKEEIKKKDDQITKLQGENIQSKTGDWLETQKEKRELSDEQMKFIKLDLKKFKPTDPDKAEDEFNKHIDDKVDELNLINKDVFGKEPEKKEKTPGSGPSDKKGDDSTVDDMSLED